MSQTRRILCSILLVLGHSMTVLAQVGGGGFGGGGLGDLAIRYGYQRFQTDVMLITVVLMVIMVQVIQVFGDLLIRIIRKR